MTQLETSKWALQILIDKAIYDISESTNTNIVRLSPYIKENAFITTVMLRDSNTLHQIVDAQRKLQKAFGKYHASELRRQCFSRRKINRRCKKFQPLAFLAFDIEGSRHNCFSSFTATPHGHGIMLFHESTISSFKEANAIYRTIEGGYQIRNPSPEISLIDLKPVRSVEDASRFLAYSLKLEPKLGNGEMNYAPYDFYPASSKDFPFWHLTSQSRPPTPYSSKPNRQTSQRQWL